MALPAVLIIRTASPKPERGAPRPRVWQCRFADLSVPPWPETVFDTLDEAIATCETFLPRRPAIIITPPTMAEEPLTYRCRMRDLREHHDPRNLPEAPTIRGWTERRPKR